MKRKYAKPSMSVDIFEANEYIATCSVATCNVRVKDTIGSNNVAYIDKNKKEGYQLRDERPWIGNKPCYQEHTMKGAPFTHYKHDSNGISPGGTISDVYYWKDETGDTHFTTGYQTTGSSTA